MGLPIVAIVGRPNVGKSSLFNVIVGRRSSIVEPTPGVTRDRVSAVCDYDDTYFELVDTGGYGIEDIDDLTEHIERQIHFAIEQAGLILFVVDVRDGIVPLDRKMADLLRRYHDRVRLVANKVDQPNLAPQAAEFSQLGFGEAQCVSAVHGLGRHELKELILEHVGRTGGGAPEDPVMKIALVGRRNTGKSTFINALAGQERVIVSEVPGTTRDAVDVRFEKDGRVVLAIDTAGVRKKGKIADAIEFYGYTRATRSIRRADVVLLLIDATVPISQVDKKLATYVVEQYKATVIVVNKWDLAKGKADTGEYGEYLAKTLIGLDYAPVVFTSAIDNRNVLAAVDVASSLFKQFRTRVTTGQVNRAMEMARSVRGPSTKRGVKPPKIYYATQVATQPPTIILFVNHPSSFRKEYLRFLLNRFRETLPFEEVPIRLVLRPRRASLRAGARVGWAPPTGSA